MKTRYPFSALVGPVFLATTMWSSAQSANDVLALARLASGGDAWDHAAIVSLFGTDRIKGIMARWHEVVDLGTGRFSDTTDYDIFRTVLTWDGRALWRQGRSGGVHPINSSFALRNNATNAWLAARGYLKQAALGARLSDPAERTESGRNYTAITATPPGGEPVELWFDGQSHFLVRTVQLLPTTVRTIRYGDYRSVEGVRLPFTMLADEGDDANADHIVVTQAKVEGGEGVEFARPQAPEDYSIASGKVTVPIGFDGFVTVKVRINGKGPFTFILDTGGRALLTPSTASALGLKLVGSGNAGGVGENLIGFHYAKVDRTEIGGLTVRGLVYGVLPMDYDTIERGSGPPFAGILGLELFERLAMRLDYRHRQLTFSRFSEAPHNGLALPITFEDDMPIIFASIDGIQGEVALDTGSPVPMTVQGIWADRNGLKDRLRKLRLRGFGGTGGAITLWASRASIGFAGTEVPSIVTYYAEDRNGSLSSRTTAGIAGNPVLAGFTLSFDYAHGRISFETEAGNRQQPYDRSGLSVFKADRSAFTVGAVADGSPAADAGLHEGDAIVAADGEFASMLSGWDFARLMRRSPGTTIRLTVRRDGKQLNIALILRELLP